MERTKFICRAMLQDTGTDISFETVLDKTDSSSTFNSACLNKELLTTFQFLLHRFCINAAISASGGVRMENESP